jgi:hypothetical protein
MGDFAPPGTWDLPGLCRRLVAHELRLGPAASADFDMWEGYTMLKAQLVSALHDVGDAFVSGNARKYRLKGDLVDSTTAFWILYPVPTFLGEVGKRGDSGLLPLPSLGPARILRFIETDEFIRFVADTTRIVDAGTPALVHCLFALIDMAIHATSRIVDRFISLGVFDKLSTIPIVAKPLVQLIAKVPEIARFRPDGSPPPRKVDRAKVLQDFAQQQATFLARVDIDMAPPDDPTFMCVFCHEPIAADAAAIMWSPPGPPTCPHYCHTMCYAPGECPVCGAGETIFMPIVLAG